MISFRADLLQKLNKPKPIYYVFDDSSSLKREWDPVSRKVWNSRDGWYDLDFEGDVRVFKVDNYYVLDHKTPPYHMQTFMGNTYVGEYDHIDENGNMIFKDTFSKEVYPITEWVLTDEHERGKLLKRRK